MALMPRARPHFSVFLSAHARAHFFNLNLLHDKIRTASIALHRLRSGHNHLNGHRSKYKPITSLCRNGCNTREDANHVLIVCPVLEQFRTKIKHFFTKYSLEFNKETVFGYNSKLAKKLFELEVQNNILLCIEIIASFKQCLAFSCLTFNIE